MSKDKRIAEIRSRVRASLHSSLDHYLSEIDPETDMPTIDVLIAFLGKGWHLSVGVSCIEPDEETPVEEEARSSGIEIVKA